MDWRAVAVKLCVTLAAVGFIGYASGSLAAGVVAAVATVAAVLIYGLSDRVQSWKSPDVLRADDADEHEPSPGPAPRGPG
jgi:hypothetical protein